MGTLGGKGLKNLQLTTLYRTKQKNPHFVLKKLYAFIYQNVTHKYDI